MKLIQVKFEEEGLIVYLVHVVSATVGSAEEVEFRVTPYPPVATPESELLLRRRECVYSSLPQMHVALIMGVIIAESGGNCFQPTVVLQPRDSRRQFLETCFFLFFITK